MAFYSGWFDVDTGAGDITVSDPGFQPQIVRFVAVSLAGSGLATGDRQVMRGWSDGTRDWFSSHYEVDAATSTNTDSRTGSADALNEINNAGAETGNFSAIAFNASGFVVTRGDPFAAATRVYYWCANGFTNVRVHAFQLAGSAGTLNVTGVGFQPDAAIVEMNIPTAEDTGTANGLVSIGWTDGTNQACAAYRVTNAVTTNYTARRIATDLVAMNCSATGGAPNESLAFSAWAADGVDLTQVGTSQRRFVAVCFQGGPLKLATTTTSQTGTGAFSVTTTGIVPTCALFLATPPATAAGGAEAGQISIGVSDGTRQWCVNHGHYDAGTLAGGGPFTDPLSFTAENRVMQHRTRSATDTYDLTGDFSVTSFASGQINCNQDDADTALVLVPVFVFGTAAAGGDVMSSRGIGRGILRGVLR